jgi:hypothetical protein
MTRVTLILTLRSSKITMKRAARKIMRRTLIKKRAKMRMMKMKAKAIGMMKKTLLEMIRKDLSIIQAIVPHLTI